MANQKKTTTEDLIKASFNLRPTIPQKLKYIALMDKTTQTAILDELLSDYVAKWEKKNGEIKLK